LCSTVTSAQLSPWNKRICYSLCPCYAQGEVDEGNPRDFGWGVANPLIAVSVEGKQAGPLAMAASCCQVDRPNVFLLTLKRAENGDGIIVRLIETEGQAVTVSLTLPLLTVEKALRTNLAEENEDEVASARIRSRCQSILSRLLRFASDRSVTVSERRTGRKPNREQTRRGHVVDGAWSSAGSQATNKAPPRRRTRADWLPCI